MFRRISGSSDLLCSVICNKPDLLCSVICKKPKCSLCKRKYCHFHLCSIIICFLYTCFSLLLFLQTAGSNFGAWNIEAYLNTYSNVGWWRRTCEVVLDTWKISAKRMYCTCLKNYFLSIHLLWFFSNWFHGYGEKNLLRAYAY